MKKDDWIIPSNITKAVSLSIFILMSIVSLVIFFTEKHLAISDFLIIKFTLSAQS